MRPKNSDYSFSRVTILRHGNTDKGLQDRLRPLSVKGIEQAVARRAQLGNPQFDLIIHSGILRTQDTAKIIAGVTENAEMISVPQLYPDESDPHGQALDRVFEKLGHVSLSEYYLAGVEPELTILGNRGHQALNAKIKESKAKDVLVVCHGILLQATCIPFVQRMKPFMYRIVGECEGFVLIPKSHLDVRIIGGGQ